MTDLKFGWRNLNKKFYFIQDSRDGIVKDYNWNSYTEQDFSRGTDAIAFSTFTLLICFFIIKLLEYFIIIL